MNTEFSLNQMIKQQVRTWDVLDPKVLHTMTHIPRNRFVPLEYQAVAFADFNIPISPMRAMMRPKIVGRILQALEIKPTDLVLEIGTGSGYLTACLASLAHKVVSIDDNTQLLTQANQICEDLNLTNIKFEQSHGFIPEGERHFDAIVITGSVSHLDTQFRHLLTTGGRLFATVGTPPVMEARVITRIEPDQFLTETVFESDIAPLEDHSSPTSSFEF